MNLKRFLLGPVVSHRGLFFWATVHDVTSTAAVIRRTEFVGQTFGNSFRCKRKLLIRRSVLAG
jgi:hypothetical protein